MIRRNLFLGIFLLTAAIPAAYGEIYSWTDDQGTVHFTEDGSAVPPEYRNSARSTEETMAPETESAPARQTGAGDDQSSRPKGATAAAETERFDFETWEQWQEELQKQETAMVKLRSRLDGIAAAVKKIPVRTPEQDNLVAEHNGLLATYKAMQARYSQLVEAARAAGFPVTLQQ